MPSISVTSLMDYRLICPVTIQKFLIDQVSGSFLVDERRADKKAVGVWPSIYDIFKIEKDRPEWLEGPVPWYA